MECMFSLFQVQITHALTCPSYHCLFCKGYEERGQETVGMLAIGAVANVQSALHMARMARQLSDSVTVYTHGDSLLAIEIKDAASGSEWLRVDSRPIARFQKGDFSKTVIVHFEDQTKKEEGFLVSIFCCRVLPTPILTFSAGP